MLNATIGMAILASSLFALGLWGAAGSHPRDQKQNKPRNK
jgi:hypothetical protein